MLAHSGAGLYHSPYYLMPYWPRLPTILTIYDLIPLRYPKQVSPQARLAFRWATALALRSARHLVAISKSTADDFQRAFRLPAALISVIPLAAGTQFKPQSLAEIRRVGQQYTLPEKYILYFGINKPHKNLERLVQAIAYAGAGGESLNPSARLVIAGAWDPRYPEAAERARESGLGDRVRFLGPVPEADLPGLYAGASALVFPSLYEGFGLPVLEAMACGVPVACADTSSLAEIATGSAVLFDPLSPQAIAEAVLGLLADPGLQGDLIERGLRRASEFSWERTAEATLRVYRNEAGE
jgi:alpha-1,3-rhamnosyl/mannosyltransferase